MKKENKIFTKEYGNEVRFTNGLRDLSALLCVGSCDARNLNRYFTHIGATSLNNPYDIFYNPIALEQEFLRVFTDKSNWKKLCYRFRDQTDKKYYFRDPWRSWIKASSLPELQKLNRDFDRVSREALLNCSALILVLGLAEVWSRLDYPDFPLNRVPVELPVSVIKKQYLSFPAEKKLLDRALGNIAELINHYLPKKTQVMIAVSPIPLKYSNTTGDILFANYQTKTALFQAAQNCCESNKRIKYFPYYEYIHGLADPWQIDGRHLKPEAIIKVARLCRSNVKPYRSPSRRLDTQFYVPKVDKKGNIIGKLFTAQDANE